MSQMGRFLITSGAGAPVLTLTSDVGGAVPPDGAGNINVLGGNNLTGTGNPGTSTITFDLTGTTNHTIQIGNASGSLTSLAAALDGQIPIGSTGVDPVIANITPGAGISIANGPGTITISATATGFTWQVIAINQMAVANEGYFTNGGAPVLVTLPAVSAVGDTFEVAAMSASGWIIIQGAGQQVRLGNQATTIGGAGTIASTGIGDWITLVCNVANTNWMARMEQGNANVT